ncbi:hypothetical protein HII31_04742 [Pseudocercospora fuligena]|uniref:Uncharacterized protein n=1 Tax=Pseudocercospora fuligena TaxID=685502 RepID=A0A8H6RNE6_9PEZI|nr:hypothetical protein HII31_04742 [Pseudocercospora fuligena]
MSSTNPALASASSGAFNATLEIKIPGSLVKDWEIPAQTLSVQSTVDEVLALIKSHIIKCLKEASYIDNADFTGFMERLGENIQNPSICFATSVSPVINDKPRGPINLDDEHAKRFNTVRDLFTDPAQLGGSTRLDLKIVLNICPQPAGVQLATDLDNVVHSRHQSAK